MKSDNHYNLREIIDNTSDSIWAVDTDYKILFMNNTFQKGFMEILEMELKEGDNILDKLSAEIREIWKERYQSVFSNKKENLDEIIFTPEGNLYFNLSLSPIYNNQHEVIGATGSARDVTDKRKRKLELEKYNALLQASLESQKDTIQLSIDPNYNYMYFNQTHRVLMNEAYGVDIKYGMNILECITDEDDREIARQNYQRALNGESHHNIREYGDLQKEYFESYYNPIYNSDNEIIGASAMARVITDRIKLEENQRNASEALKGAVETKNKFFSLIAHDLRSPMSSVSALSGFIYDHFDGFNKEELKTYVTHIKEATTHAWELLEDLLLWSRAQNDTISFNPESFNLSVLCDDTIKSFKQLLSAKKIKIKSEYNQEIEIDGDKNMISTVLRNLLSNAIKFSHPESEIEIHIHQDLHHTEIIVRDYGTGIHPTIKPKLFKEGEKVSLRGTAEEKGSGLGLIMCKEFVERHQGSITVDSEVGKGTTINIIIPKI